MPMRATLFLAECELIFQKIMQSMQQKQEDQELCFIRPFTLEIPELIIESEADKFAETQIQLYLYLISMINLSLNIKIRLPPVNQAEFKSLELENQKIKQALTDYLSQLKEEQAAVLAEISALPTIRVALYFMINSAILNPNWICRELSKSLIKTLLIHSGSSKESEILHYLEFLLHISDQSSMIIEASEQNPYLITHFQFQFISSTHKLITTMNACPLAPDCVPKFIHSTIHDGFLYMFIRNLYRLHLTTPESLAVLRAITPKILNPLEWDLNFDQSSALLYFIGHFYMSLKINTRLYTQELHQAFFTKAWFGYLSFYLLTTYHSFDEAQPIEGQVISLLTQFFSELIQTNTPDSWTEFHASPQLFWEICGKFVSYPGLTNLDFIYFSKTFLPDLVDNLANYHLWGRLKAFLNNFFVQQELIGGEFDPSWVYLEQLKQHLNFFDQVLNLVARTHPADPLPALVTVLDKSLIIEVKEKKIATMFAKTLFTKFRQNLIQAFIAQLELISKHLDISRYTEAAIDNLYLMQHLSHQFLHNLQATPAEISLSERLLKVEELLDLRARALEDPKLEVKTKTAKNKSTGLKPKKTIPSTAVLEDTHANQITKESIPDCLRQLALDLKTEFNTKLILTGGAVTHLYLRRPNPNDYDCLLFNQDMALLFAYLNKKGYLGCHIVGKSYPILKLKMQNHENIIEVDISIVSSAKYVHLDLAMAEVLAQRDFKLNALYLEINPEAEMLMIHGFDHALHSVNLKQIAAVDNPKRGLKRNIFSEDPLRSFRLVKIILQYPDFKPDGQLNRTLKTQPLAPILQRFMQDDLAQARIGTYLDDLFQRFDFLQVLTKLGEYKILEGLSGLQFSTLLPYFGLLTEYLASATTITSSLGFFKAAPCLESSTRALAYAKKLAFFQLITAVYFLEHPAHGWSDWLSAGLVHKIKPRDQVSLNSIHEAVQSGNPKLIKEMPLMQFLTAICEIKFAEKPRLSPKSG